MVLENQKIYIIGIGEDGLEGLSESARTMIQETEYLFGDRRVLQLISTVSAERYEVGTDLDQALQKIKELKVNSANITVIATGDPLFYGFARYLCDHLGKQSIEVVPHVSSMQLAFARVKESWEDAYLTNLSNQSLEQVVDRIRSAEKVGLFTTEEITPALFAQNLLAQSIDYFTVYVCENLGSPDERVTHTELSELVDQSFSPLNVMILIRKPDAPDRPRSHVGRRIFGNPEEFFNQAHSQQNLSTPAEIRSIALSEMDLGPQSVVWDIGAGHGSISIEAAQISNHGTVYAIEMNPDDFLLLKANIERFQVPNVIPILGKAPDAWNELPDPDSLFIEGSGREIARIVDLAFQRLRPNGRLVASVGSIENLSELHRTMTQKTPNVKVWMINIARGVEQMERMQFDAMNPRFLLSLVK